MRELLLKNFVSKDKRQKELFLSEHFESEGIAQDFEKKITYTVVDILEFTDTLDLELFLEQKKKEDLIQTYVVKARNTRAGINKFIYKIVGEQYVVFADKVFVLKISQYIKRVAAKQPLVKKS